MSFPGLRLLAAQGLFDVFESVFDRPSSAIACHDFFRGSGKVGGEEEVVLFLAFRISADHQEHGPI